jgi:peroxiredoxin
MNAQDNITPRWMVTTLMLAGVYNLAWGAVVVLMPMLVFDLFAMDAPVYPGIWQCVGMIVGVYGIGYAMAARDPMRHWPIVLVGLLGKIFGPIGFLMAASSGELPWRFGLIIVFNDLIWLYPFAAILYAATRRAQSTGTGSPLGDWREAATNRGATLGELSSKQPVLLVMLRHLGCLYCRETMADLAGNRARLEQDGVMIVIGHMSEEKPDVRRIFKKYGLHDLPRVSDPERRLYQALELRRGRLGQLFGWRNWFRAPRAIMRTRNVVGRLMGDGFQLPGSFLLHRGAIVRAHRNAYAADRPDYCELALGGDDVPPASVVPAAS